MAHQSSVVVEPTSASPDKQKKRFRPLAAVRKLFRANRKGAKNRKITSHGELRTGDGTTDDDDDDGGFKKRSVRLASTSEDSIFCAVESKGNRLKKPAASIEGINRLGIQNELVSKLNKRRSINSDDDGLPVSPGSSFTTADVILGSTLKTSPVKSASRDSDKSLLSIDGSENEDEDLFMRTWTSSVASVIKKDDKSSRHSIAFDGAGEVDFNAIQDTSNLNLSHIKHRIAVKPPQRHLPQRALKHQRVSVATGLPQLREESPSKSALRTKLSPISKKLSSESNEARKPLLSPLKSPGSSSPSFPKSPARRSPSTESAGVPPSKHIDVSLDDPIKEAPDKTDNVNSADLDKIASPVSSPKPTTKQESTTATAIDSAEKSTEHLSERNDTHESKENAQETHETSNASELNTVFGKLKHVEPKEEIEVIKGNNISDSPITSTEKTATEPKTTKKLSEVNQETPSNRHAYDNVKLETDRDDIKSESKTKVTPLSQRYKFSSLDKDTKPEGDPFRKFSLDTKKSMVSATTSSNRKTDISTASENYHLVLNKPTVQAENIKNDAQPIDKDNIIVPNSSKILENSSAAMVHDEQNVNTDSSTKDDKAKIDTSISRSGQSIATETNLPLKKSSNHLTFSEKQPVNEEGKKKDVVDKQRYLRRKTLPDKTSPIKETLNEAETTKQARRISFNTSKTPSNESTPPATASPLGTASPPAWIALAKRKTAERAEKTSPDDSPDTVCDKTTDFGKTEKFTTTNLRKFSIDREKNDFFSPNGKPREKQVTKSDDENLTENQVTKSESKTTPTLGNLRNRKVTPKFSDESPLSTSNKENENRFGKVNKISSMQLSFNEKMLAQSKTDLDHQKPELHDNLHKQSSVDDSKQKSKSLPHESSLEGESKPVPLARKPALPGNKPKLFQADESQSSSGKKGSDISRRTPPTPERSKSMDKTFGETNTKPAIGAKFSHTNEKSSSLTSPTKEKQDSPSETTKPRVLTKSNLSETKVSSPYRFNSQISKSPSESHRTKPEVTTPTDSKTKLQSGGGDNSQAVKYNRTVAKQEPDKPTENGEPVEEVKVPAWRSNLKPTKLASRVPKPESISGVKDKIAEETKPKIDFKQSEKISNSEEVEVRKQPAYRKKPETDESEEVITRSKDKLDTKISDPMSRHSKVLDMVKSYQNLQVS